MPPKSADDHAKQAVALLELGQYERCHRAASQALALDPDHLGALRLQAICAVELGRPDAERVARTLLHREPDAAYSHRVMCRLYRKCLNNPVMAVRAGAKACETDPHDAAAAYELAASLAKCGDRRAIDEARRAVALDPADLQYRGMLTAILSQFDHDAEASRLAEQILAEDPGNTTAMLVKGDTQIRQSWGAHSLAWYGRALAGSPQSLSGVRAAIDNIISVWGHRFLLASVLPLLFIAPMMQNRVVWPLGLVLVVFIVWLVRLFRLIPRSQHRFLRRYPLRQPWRFAQWVICAVVWVLFVVVAWRGESMLGLLGPVVILLFGGSMLGHVPVRER